METIKEMPEINIGQRMDEIEAAMAQNLDLLDLPITHRFTNGLYIREVELPQATLVTSKIHKTQHQFFLLKGMVTVWDKDGNENTFSAPYFGITEPNNRRIVYAWCDSVWATAHPNPENKTIDEIENELFEEYNNEFLELDSKNKILESQHNSKEKSKVVNKLITNKK